VLSVNRFGAEQLGYQVEELVGHSVLGLFYEDDGAAVVARLSDCLATPEATRHWEFRKVRKDGSVIWVRETVRVGQSSAGETVVLVACEDVTERRINELILAAEYRILEAVAADVSQKEIMTLACRLFEEISTGTRCSILFLDRDGLHLRHGAAPSLPEPYIQAIDGVAIGPTVGSCGTAAFTRRQVIVSDIARDPLWADYRDIALSHGLLACWSSPLIDSDGTVLGAFAVYSCNPQQPTDVDLRLIGQMVQIVCIAVERKRTMDALQVSEERLNLATHGSNTGIWDWDLETNEVYFSPIWKSMLGYAEHELRGEFSEWNERIHPDDRVRAQATVRACLDGAALQYELEHRLRHKDGSYRWILARGVTLSNARGAPYRMAGSHIDITERKRMEESLRQQEFNLRAAIEERERISQDLHDGILQSLFAVGLALESAKSMMTASALKKEGQPLDQAINQLNYVMREIRNFIAGLGSDLLQGKDLTLVLKQMLASLTENQATNVRLTVEDRAAKALSAEQSLHLIRVIQEAVSNCIQHGHASEARVSLKILKRAIRLNIRDNGRGFSQTDAKKTGHGLRNMASRAQKIGGKFSVLSKVNEGTSIVLDLPREAVDARR
jgi:PAS domain S-box-containing protein